MTTYEEPNLFWPIFGAGFLAVATFAVWAELPGLALSLPAVTLILLAVGTHLRSRRRPRKPYLVAAVGTKFERMVAAALRVK